MTNENDMSKNLEETKYDYLQKSTLHRRGLCLQ